MKLHADVHARADLLAQSLEPLHDFLDEFHPLVVLERRARVSSQLHFHRVHACIFAQPSVHSHAVARRTAEQLIDRHPERLALDVPQRLIDAAGDRRLDRTAAIKSSAMNRLPVMHYRHRILPER